MVDSSTLIQGASKAPSSNRPSKEMWCFRAVLLSFCLIQTASSQTIPWLIDTVVSSNLSTRTTPNLVDTAKQGTTNLYLSTGLPVFGGELITNGLYYRHAVFDNIRAYTASGT